MKALLINFEGDMTVIETPEVGVAGIAEDDLQAVADGDAGLTRWNEDRYEMASVDAEENEDGEGETSYEISWSLI